MKDKPEKQNARLNESDAALRVRASLSEPSCGLSILMGSGFRDLKVTLEQDVPDTLDDVLLLVVLLLLLALLEDLHGGSAVGGSERLVVS